MKVKQLEIRKARIEIIPMIDAIFFLLVFFMFSSLSMIRMSGSSVALPAKTQGTAKAGAGQKVIVSVTADGQMYLGHNRVSPGSLRETLQTQFAKQADAVVVINMDKRQKAQKLISVLDSINQVTLPSGQHPSVLIATEPVLQGRAAR